MDRVELALELWKHSGESKPSVSACLAMADQFLTEPPKECVDGYFNFAFFLNGERHIVYGAESEIDALVQFTKPLMPRAPVRYLDWMG